MVEVFARLAQGNVLGYFVNLGEVYVNILVELLSGRVSSWRA